MINTGISDDEDEDDVELAREMKRVRFSGAGGQTTSQGGSVGGGVGGMGGSSSEAQAPVRNFGL